MCLFDVIRLSRLAVKDLDNTLRDFLADRDSIWNADQVRVLEFYTGTLLSIVDQSIQSGGATTRVNFIRSTPQLLIDTADGCDDYIERSNRCRQNDPITVVEEFNGGAKRP